MQFLEHWPLDRLKALYRCAKSTGMFKDPHCMMRLRAIIATKEKTHEPQSGS